MRSLIGGLIALAALMAMPGIAAADSELGDSGEIGAHSLRDSYSKPGVTCNYSDGTSRLQSFSVRPPRLSSDDAFASPVGWKIQVQRRAPSSNTWKTIDSSSVQHGWASEGNWAAFTKRTFSPAFPSDPEPKFTDYRVLVVMLQFYGDGSVAGKATHLVDYYYSEYFMGTFGPGGSCARKASGVF